MTTETLAMALLTHPFQVLLAGVALYYAVKGAVAEYGRRARPVTTPDGRPTLGQAA